MDDKMDEVLSKLQRIQQLWTEAKGMKPSDPEYKTIVEKIRVLSDEYKALIEPSKTPKQSK